MKVRQDSRWPDAHVRLKKLYEQRVPQGMTQEQFGAEYGIGTQGMVWQYLTGYTPLNYDAAAKFAQGLRCTIKDISPEMDEALRTAILPALGLRAWRRAAVSATLALIVWCALPSTAEARPQFDIIAFAAAHNTHCASRKKRAFMRTFFERIYSVFSALVIRHILGQFRTNGETLATA